MEEVKKTRTQLLEDLKFFIEDKPDELSMFQETINKLNEAKMQYRKFILECISNTTGEKEHEYNGETKARIEELRIEMAGLKNRADGYMHEYVGSCIGLITTGDQLNPGELDEKTKEERKAERQQLIDMLTVSCLDELSTPQQIDLTLTDIEDVNKKYGYFPQIALENDGTQK